MSNNSEQAIWDSLSNFFTTTISEKVKSALETVVNKLAPVLAPGLVGAEIASDISSRMQAMSKGEASSIIANHVKVINLGTYGSDYSMYKINQYDGAFKHITNLKSGQISLIRTKSKMERFFIVSNSVLVLSSVVNADVVAQWSKMGRNDDPNLDKFLKEFVIEIRSSKSRSGINQNPKLGPVAKPFIY